MPGGSRITDRGTGSGRLADTAAVGGSRGEETMRRIPIRRAGCSGLALWLALLLLPAALLATPGITAGGALRAAAQPTTTPPATGTAAATPTPRPTPTATPRAGTLTVTPPAGPAGTQFTITGAGFSPNALLAVAVEDDDDHVRGVWDRADAAAAFSALVELGLLRTLLAWEAAFLPV